MATAGVDLSAINPEELPNASAMRIGIVVSEWNAEITENLHLGALEAIKKCGGSPKHTTRLSVPGSFELVYGAKLLCRRETFDAVIVIGSVIRGETSHFDFVCQGVTNGISQLNINFETPVIFCVLTDDTIEQSRARSGGVHGNKGVEAAVAAIKMAGLRKVVG